MTALYVLLITNKAVLLLLLTSNAESEKANAVVVFVSHQLQVVCRVLWSVCLVQCLFVGPMRATKQQNLAK